MLRNHSDLYSQIHFSEINRMYKVKTPKKLDFAIQIHKTPLSKKLKATRLKVFWINDRNQQCKKIIGQNRCFCSHSFEQHQIINTHKPYCIIEGCKCQCYEYVPFTDIRCMCRHSYKNHHLGSRMCQMCEKCLGFSTNWCCKCGLRYNEHQTVMKFQESRDRSLSKSQQSKGRQQEQEDKQNKLQASMISLPKTSRVTFPQKQSLLDQYNKQAHKYTVEITSRLHNQEQKRKERLKILERVNKKFNQSSLQDHYQKNQSYFLEPPQNTHQTTPLQLYLKPHQYRFIDVDQLLGKQYKKYERQLSELSIRSPKNIRKF